MGSPFGNGLSPTTTQFAAGRLHDTAERPRISVVVVVPVTLPFAIVTTDESPTAYHLANPWRDTPQVSGAVCGAPATPSVIATTRSPTATQLCRSGHVISVMFVAPAMVCGGPATPLWILTTYHVVPG